MRLIGRLYRILLLPMKGLIFLVNLVSFKINRVKIVENWNIEGIVFIINEGKIRIGRNLKANSAKHANPIGGDTVLRFIVRKGGELVIGDHVGISNSTIVCWKSIEIGDYVFIGGGCKIWDTDFHSTNPVDRIHKFNKNVKTANIRLSDYVFIGGGSTILKGVSIGKNSVVAAGSVVTKSIPENQVWGGNPAHFIRRLQLPDNSLESKPQ